MNNAPPSRWTTLWRKTEARQDDWADLGTAFGLDLSMDPEAPAPATTPPEPKPRSGWMSRLSIRRRAAA